MVKRVVGAGWVRAAIRRSRYASLDQCCDQPFHSDHTPERLGEQPLWGLKSLGMENSVYWDVTAMMAVAFLFSLRLPKQAAYLHHDL